MYNFDEIINRNGTNSVKWDSVTKKYNRNDLLPMWVADMDFKIAPEIADAVIERAKHMTYGYTFPGTEYINSIIRWNKKRHNFDVKKEWISVSPGVIPAIKAAIYGFSDVNDKILILTPVYTPFHNSVKEANRELITSSLIFDGEKYNIDFDDFEQKIKYGVKLFIMSNPHNPIGRVWSKEELSKIADICFNNNVIVLSDEIHSDIIYKNKKHTVFNTVSENARNISIVCQAPSKTFNIAGLCTSHIIIESEKVRKQMQKSMSSIGIELVNIFGIVACEAAYTYGDQWVDEMVEYVEGNADFVCKYIKEKLPLVKTYKPESTYLMWLDFRLYNLKQEELMEKLVNEGKVVLNSGTDYGTEGVGFIRLNIGCPRSIVKECIDRIEKAFNKK